MPTVSACRHTLNRWSLLSIYAISKILPFIILSFLLHDPEAEAEQGTIEIGEVSGGITKIYAGHPLTKSAESIIRLMLGVYIIGAMVTAIYFLVGRYCPK